MRFLVLLLVLLSPAAFAQTASAPTAPAKIDWKSLGRPLDDDSKPMLDRYVYNDTDKMDSNVSLNRAVLPQKRVAEWVSQNLGQVMTLDGAQYDKQVYNNRLLFTPDGYADYVVYLKGTKLGDFLKSNQYKIAAFVDGSPNVLSEGLETVGNSSVYSWQVTAILVLSYLDYRNQLPAAMFKNNPKADNRLLIQAKLDIVRIPVQSNGNIIAINHVIFGVPPAPSTTESLDPAPAGE